MDTEDATPLPPKPGVAPAPAAPSAAPVIPPPPPRGRRGPRSASPRAWIWPLALVAGGVLGVVAYGFVQGVEPTFDRWLALVVG